MTRRYKNVVVFDTKQAALGAFSTLTPDQLFYKHRIIPGDFPSGVEMFVSGQQRLWRLRHG